MARGYRPADRDQQFLLPPDVRDWVPAGHVVWSVLEVLEQADTAVFHARSRTGGAGRAGYDPQVLLAVLMLGYCTGQRSSRQLERLCETDAAFRVACANDVPDHTVLARFRQAHALSFEGLFSQVLLVAARTGLVNLETVAVDGTKIAADASMDANRDAGWVRARARQIVAEAEQVDAAEDAAFGDARGDEPDPAMADPGTRGQKVAELLKELAVQDQHASDTEAEQRRAEVVAGRQRQMADGRLASGRHPGDPAQRAELARRSWQIQHDRQQAKADAYALAVAEGRPRLGKPPVPAQDHKRVQRAKAAYEKARAHAEAAARAATSEQVMAGPAVGTSRRQVNLTDPQSRIMKTRKGWVQGYNVQVAVSADQVILATAVSQRSNDKRLLVPMMTAAQAAVGLLESAGVQASIGTVLADAGYASHANLTAGGPDRLIALGSGRRQARRPITDSPPGPDEDPAVAMQRRLDTDAGRALYKRRGATVEPAIGNLKKLLDRFSRRGHTAAQTETWLAAAAFNLLKIHRAQLA